MSSLFHFFADLAKRRDELARSRHLESFPFDECLLSCRRKGAFPDLAIRINRGQPNNPFLRGGELIEVKDRKDSYSIASFNSTIPTGSKPIADLTTKGKLAEIMRESGDDIDSLPIRQVYYLLRGKKKNADTKICLVHGSFFETISPERLIGEILRQTLAEAGVKLPDELPPDMARQEIYAAVRRVENSSVSLRFRVMTESRPEANILKNYPEIPDNSLSLVIPLHGESEEQHAAIERQIQDAAQLTGLDEEDVRYSRIKHPFNGWFCALTFPLA